MKSINAKSNRSIALYHYQACPFCSITREALKYINLDVEQRDTLKEPRYRKELIAGGGKSQVPCLKIEQRNETTQWLYESRDIINYLQTYEASFEVNA